MGMWEMDGEDYGRLELVQVRVYLQSFFFSDFEFASYTTRVIYYK